MFAIAAPATGEPVLFGVSGPLTGQNAQYGAQWRAGFDLAQKFVNDKRIRIELGDFSSPASMGQSVSRAFRRWRSSAATHRPTVRSTEPRSVR